MNLVLKPVGEQAIVIAGDTSVIALEAAQEAARRGARVVLAGRDADALERVVGDIRRAGGRAIAVEADVARPAFGDEVAAAAAVEFGRLDSWVTVGRAYAPAARAALPSLRRGGGALIAVTDDAAATAFTDNLRQALEDAGAPVFVTVLQPRKAAVMGILRAAQHPLRSIGRAV